MSYADKVFVEMCRKILNDGTITTGEKVRPIWKDTGEPAYTIKDFGVVNRYDLSKEFPAITLRKVPIKSCTEEMLWIWQRNSNKIADLDSSIWDEWRMEDGTIGKAYGYQMGKVYRFRDITEKGLKNAFGDGIMKNFSVDHKNSIRKMYINGNRVAFCFDDGVWGMNQINKVLYDLRLTPFSRRILTNMYSFEDLSEMALYPCAYSLTLNVTEDIKGRLVLNGILNQRSQDILAANAWNVCQYAVLIHMIARDVGMGVGEFIHVIADAHIYDRHVYIIKELIKRKQFDAPKFWLNPEKNDFYSFTKEDVKLLDYEYGEPVKDIPIAV